MIMSALASLLRTRSTRVLSLAAVAALAVAYVASSYLRFKRRVAKGFKFPELEPPTFPLGHVLLLGNYLQCLERLEACKDPVTGLASLWLGSMQVVMVHKAEHINKILNASNYREAIPALQSHFDVILGKRGITALMHDEWRLVRGLMSKPFQFSQLRGMAATMASVAEQLAQHLHTLPPGQEFDIHPVLKLATLDIIGLTAFGHDFACVANAAKSPSAEVTAFEFMLSEYSRRIGSANPFSNNYWFPTAANRAHARASRTLRGRLDGFVRQRRADIAAGTAGGKDDFLGHMLEAAGSSGAKLPDSMLSDQLVTLMFGGYDTTSIALSFAVFIVATDPEIQRELQHEVDQVLQGRVPTYDDFNNLKYTTQVIKESLRIYPPAPLTTRCLEEPLELEPGLVLPTGTTTWLPLISSQRSTLNWADPLVAKPERFAQGNVIPPGAWVPFSGGPRNCIGMKFALLEATLVLAVLAQHFTFSTRLPPGILPTVLWGIVQKPVDGMPVALTPRAKAPPV